MRANEIGGPYKLVQVSLSPCGETKLTFGTPAERGKYRTSYFAKVTLYGLPDRLLCTDRSGPWTQPHCQMSMSSP
jgi:hypothetical protein